MNRLFSNDNPALRIMRDVGLGVVDRLPELKRLFVREAAGDGIGSVPRAARNWWIAALICSKERPCIRSLFCT